MQAQEIIIRRRNFEQDLVQPWNIMAVISYKMSTSFYFKFRFCDIRLGIIG